MNEFNETDGQLSKLYGFFFESHPTPIYVWKYFEDDFILIKYNEAADIVTKGKMKDFLGKKASEHYKDRPDILEDLYSCNRNKTSFSKELKYYYQTLNEEKILNVNYYFIQPELVLVHIEDITDRKKAEEKLKEDEKILKESEENFRNIAEQSFMGIEILQDGKIKYANDAVSKILEYSIQEMKEWKFNELFKFIHPDDLHIAQEQWKVRQEEGGKKVINYSLRVITKSGIIKWFEIISKIVRYQGRQATFVVINDVTDMKKAEQKLKESEKKYRNLVDNINDILIEVDVNRNISYISPQAYNILGYQPEEIIGTNARDLIHPDEDLIEKEVTLNALRSGEPLYNEHRVKHKDGHYILLAMKGNVVKIDDHIKIIGIFRDITAQREAEQKLKDSEEKYRSLMDGLSRVEIGVDVVSYDCKVLFQNQILINRFGDISRKFCYEQYMGLKNPCEFCPMIKAIKNNRIETAELIGADGRNYEILSAPFPNPDGTIEKAVEVIIDITEHKQIEQKLKDSEEKYRNIIESMGDAIHVIDRDLRIIYSNLAFHKWLKNLNIDVKLEGKTVFEAFPFLPEKVRDEYLQVFNSGTTIITEETNKIKTEEILTETRKIPIIKEKKVEQIITIIRNITERRIAEQKLRDSEEKYRNAYNRSNLYKDLFTHDINNILQIILSSIELFSLRINNKEISQKFDEILTLIKEQITRGSKLVKNVQKLSEIEDTKKPLISIDPYETLRKSIDFLRNSFHYKNLDVKVISTQNKLFVKGNDLLPNIFENILLNAVKHNLNEKIEILIKISKVKKDQTDCIKFEFIDNGIGIPDLLKKEIFSRKPREIEKEKMTSGMGLGLILVKSILNAINGEITVEDRIKGDYTKGSNFIILIPEAK